MSNEYLNQQDEIRYIKEQILVKFPLLGVDMMNTPIIPSNVVETAATDGKNIVYSPIFFNGLTNSQKQFIIAHEVLHIAFNHILRSKDRNPKLWNIATDAVINQILIHEQLPIVEGGVNIPAAINHSAEEMYEMLLRKKEQYDQMQNQADSQSSAEQNGQQQQNQANSQSSAEQNGQQQQNQANSQSSAEQNDQQQQNQADSQSSAGQNGQQQQNQADSQSSAGQNGQQQQNQADSQSSAEQNGQQNQGGQSGSQTDDWDDSGIDWGNTSEQVGHDSHEIWKEAVREAELKEQQKQDQANKKKLWDKIKDALKQAEEQDQNSTEQNTAQDIMNKIKSALEQEQSNDKGHKPVEKGKLEDSADEQMNSYEKGFIDKNREKRREIASNIRQELREKVKAFKDNNDYITVGSIGNPTNQVVNWKTLLKKSFDEERDRWSYRRSGAENDYMARVEELEDENRPDTEVMLDVSGSVNIHLLREFLRQLKPLLKTSKLKVGCFDERFFGFQEIKNEKDIKNFRLPAGSGNGTDLDLPVRYFTKKKEINKIVFTDGYSWSMPKYDLKNVNVIWIVYGDKDFNPCCGKVIQVSVSQFQSYLNNQNIERGM